MDFTPVRPDTPDFWHLSAIILDLDGAMDDAVTDDDRQRVWDDAVKAGGIDPNALSYMGMQRAFRVLGVRTQRDLRNQAVQRQVLAMTTLYMEAFLVGVRFERERQP